MTHTFRTAGEIVTGAGSIAELGAVCARRGKRALVVTGGGSLESAGHLERARESLRASGVEFEEHAGVAREPDLDEVERIRERLRGGFDLVVAVGGGSVMDAAKAAAGLAREDGAAAEYQSGRAIASPGLPTVAVPTTAGTGSEVTPNAVITDRTDAGRVSKASIRGPGLLPVAAVVDPELLLTLPPRATAESGMDALVQAVESYVSLKATPLTEALSLEAVTLLGKGLVRAYEDGSDLDARAECAYGSLLAGIALSNARLGVVHGLAHPIGARYGLHHGLVCAVLFAPSIRLNFAAAPGRYAEVGRRLARAFSAVETRGLTRAGITREEVVRATGGPPEGVPRADELVEAMLDRLDLPRKLPCAVEREDHAAIVADAMPSGSLKANPLEIAPAHLESLMREVAGG